MVVGVVILVVGVNKYAVASLLGWAIPAAVAGLTWFFAPAPYDRLALAVFTLALAISIVVLGYLSARWRDK